MKNKIIEDGEKLYDHARRSKFACLTIGILFFVFALSSIACQPNQSILNSGKGSANSSGGNAPERPKDTYESALSGVQKSGFDYILVFRRKDGGKFVKDDRVFLRENSPAVTNQFVLTDEDRVAIAGSNYPFPEENLELLRKIFDIEDLSPPKETTASTNAANGANSNANK